MVGVITRFDTKAQMQNAATTFCAERLKAATQTGAKTTLFLSGGSTPGPVYDALSQQKLKWSKISVAQVDDRWVPLSDPGSNARLIKETILRNKAKNANFARMKSRHHSAKAGLNTVNEIYGTLPMANSVAVLGMGGDGHVCSWFPKAKGLKEALDPANDHFVQSILAKRTKVTGPYLERMTLTLSALNQCKSLLLLISGTDKLAVLEQAMNNPKSELPVSHLIRASGKRLTIMWAE